MRLADNETQASEEDMNPHSLLWSIISVVDI